MKEDKLKQLYFSHDIFSDKDEKIVKMFYYFRKHIEDFSLDFIKNNFFHASFGLFWEIVQYLHRNELTEDEIPILADELRADEEFVRLIIEKFNLFRIDENGFIVSDRILKNLNKLAEKSDKNKSSAEVRWLLSAFNKAYVEFFEEEPILEPSEIESLKKYNEKIPDLRGKLRDILYTLYCLKFDTSTNFKPCANWLLTKNNLARLLNGEFGKLKHKPTEKEIKEKQRKEAEAKAKRQEPTEIEIKMSKIQTREEAVEFIKEFYSNQYLSFHCSKAYVLPTMRTMLLNKFNITDKEVIEYVGTKKDNE